MSKALFLDQGVPRLQVPVDQEDWELDAWHLGYEHHFPVQLLLPLQRDVVARAVNAVLEF